MEITMKLIPHIDASAKSLASGRIDVRGRTWALFPFAMAKEPVKACPETLTPRQNTIRCA